MPRPKGSKNKKTVIVENIDEKITAAEREIAELTDTLKTKKAYLKELVKAKAESAKIAAAKKAEEDKACSLRQLKKAARAWKRFWKCSKVSKLPFVHLSGIPISIHYHTFSYNKRRRRAAADLSAFKGGWGCCPNKQSADFL